MFVKRAAASKDKHFLTRLFGICRLNSVDHLVLTSNFNLLHNFLPRQWWMKRRLSRVTMGPTHKIVTPAHWCTHPAQHTTWTVACHLPWDKISAWRLFYRNLRKADPLPLRLHASIINAVLVVFGLYFPYTTASWGTYPRNICILDELWYLTVVIFLSTHNSPERGAGYGIFIAGSALPTMYLSSVCSMHWNGKKFSSLAAPEVFLWKNFCCSQQWKCPDNERISVSE